jgi:hypothetical protein
MTNFTPITDGSPANAATYNAPLIELDTAINNIVSGTTPPAKLAALNLNTRAALTIAGDAITATAAKTRFQVDTEGGAGTDNLATINGGADGRVIEIQSANAARVITLKHGTGNVKAMRLTDIVLDDPNHIVTLVYDGSNWCEVAGGIGTTSLKTANVPTPAAVATIAVPDGTILAGASGSEKRLSVLPRFDVRNWWCARAANTALSGMGIADAAAVGTPTSANQTDSAYVNLAQAAATINTQGALSSTSFNLVRPSHQPNFWALIRTGPNAADITNIRLFIGLTGAVPTNVDALVTNFLGFRFSTGAGDANWQACTNNGASQSIQNTGVAVASATVYLLRMRYDPVGAVAYFSINDGAEVSLATTLPASTQDLGFTVSHWTLEAAKKNVLISRIYCEYN